jgi:hypothetical protein
MSFWALDRHTVEAADPIACRFSRLLSPAAVNIGPFPSDAQ